MSKVGSAEESISTMPAMWMKWLELRKKNIAILSNGDRGSVGLPKRVFHLVQHDVIMKLWFLREATLNRPKTVKSP